MSQIDISSGTPVYIGNPIKTSGKKNFDIGPFSFRHGYDVSGSTSAGLNYWQQQQQNAYELELWNLNNQYNSPAAQMGRFQASGLNPNLIYSQQNTSGGSAGSSAPIPAKATNFKAQNLQATAALLNGVLNTLRTVQGITDYVANGYERGQLSNSLLATQNEALENSNAFKKYFQYPLAMSRGMNQPIEITLPDGSKETIDWTKTMDAIVMQARGNQAFSDAAIKDYLLKNVYPNEATIKERETQNYQHAKEVYDSILEMGNIENPYLKAIIWKMVFSTMTSSMTQKAGEFMRGLANF